MIRDDGNDSKTELPIPCDECGVPGLEPRKEIQAFQYGVQGDEVQLEAEVVVWHCRHCGYAVTRGDAEEMRHEAVCKHEGVLTPAKIKEIRRRLGMSQAEFARFARVGEASVKRWEAGALVQNGSIDLLLRLLDDEAAARTVMSLNSEASGAERPFRFRTPVSPLARRNAALFCLRTAEAA